MSSEAVSESLFVALPPEMKFGILSFLNVNELISIRALCKESYVFTSEAIVKKLEEEFISYIRLPSTGVNKPIKLNHPVLRKYNGLLPILFATSMNLHKSVKELLKRQELNIDVTDKNGNNPYHYTVNNCNWTILESLLLADKKRSNGPKDSGLFKMNNLGLVPFMFILRMLTDESVIPEGCKEILSA